MVYKIKVTAQVEKELTIRADSEEEVKLNFDEYVLTHGISFDTITENSMRAMCYPTNNRLNVGSYINLTDRNRCNLISHN